MCFEDSQTPFNFYSFLEETNESDDDVEEDLDELGYESGLFGMNVTCTSVKYTDLKIPEDVNFPGNLLLPVGGGGAVGKYCHKSTVDCVPIIYKAFRFCGGVAKIVPGI